MISLNIWAKREGISYSHAQKLLAENKIEGAARSETGKRILIPETTKAPTRETVRCAICGNLYPQITGTHLKLHGLTWEEYTAQFPNAAMVSSEILTTIVETHLGKPKTEEHKRNVSLGKMGGVPWNKGLVGVQIPGNETRRKMSAAHTGLKHTEETKRKIGDGNRGKKMPVEDVERRAESARRRYQHEPHPNRGRIFDDAHKEMMSEVATKREANYSPEQRAAINKAIGDGVRGIKRTDEQKERYRASRVKWMSENPTKVINTAGERSIAEWLDKHRIVYVRQFVIPGLHHPYDFYLPDHETIIEFDGAHHWWRRWFAVLGKSAAERLEMLRETMAKDAFENLYAGRNGYRIIRIRGIADVGDSEEYGSLEDQLRLQGFLMPPI